MEEQNETPDNPPLEQVNGGSIKHKKKRFEIFGKLDDGETFQLQAADDEIVTLKGSEIDWDTFEDAKFVVESLELIETAEAIAEQAANDAAANEQLKDALESARQVVRSHARTITLKEREIKSLKGGANSIKFSIAAEVKRVFEKTGSAEQARHYGAMLQRLLETIATASSHVFADMYRKATKLHLTDEDEDATRVSLVLNLKEGIDIQHIHEVIIGKGTLKATMNYIDDCDIPNTATSECKTGVVSGSSSAELFSGDEMRGQGDDLVARANKALATADATKPAAKKPAASPESSGEEAAEAPPEGLSDDDLDIKTKPDPVCRFHKEAPLSAFELYLWAQACSLALSEEEEAELETKEVQQLEKYITSIRLGKTPARPPGWIKKLHRDSDWYQEGIDDREAGKQKHDNPYAEGSTFHLAWEKGWETKDA